MLGEKCDKRSKGHRNAHQIAFVEKLVLGPADISRGLRQHRREADEGEEDFGSNQI